MKHKFSTDQLPFAVLVFDARYQRSLSHAKVKKLIANWRLEDVGAITVSIRADRKAYVIDGMHRVRAAHDLGLSSTKVLCHVYRGLTLEEEARKFLALNDAKVVSAIDKYKAGLVAGNPDCVGVHDTFAKYGLRVSNAPADGVVRCVSKALALYARDPALLGGVCAILTEAWGTRSAALEQIVFTAMGSVCDRYNGEMDKSVMVRKLAGYRGGPAALVGDARGLSDYKPIGVARAASEIIVDNYNKGRRTGRLSAL